MHELVQNEPEGLKIQKDGSLVLFDNRLLHRALKKVSRAIAIHNLDYFEDENNNMFSYFELFFEPGESKNITMNFSIDSILILSEISDNKVTISAGDYEKYTSSQDNIESDNKKIVDKALELSLNLETDLEKAKRIQEWVTDSLEWSGYSSILRGSVWALENREGDCSEFTALFISLCRAVNIPSRFIHGLASDSFSEGGTYCLEEAGHDWAEVYIHDLGWVWVDPTWGWFKDNDGVHMARARVNTSR